MLPPQVNCLAAIRSFSDNDHVSLHADDRSQSCYNRHMIVRDE
jgi:hypothetical protein